MLDLSNAPLNDNYVQNYFNEKSGGTQPWTPLEVILNAYCLWIIW